MNALSWLDAWALWFSGEEVPPEATMVGISILSWGRAGKIMSFIGGLTVILDLVGPERLRKIGDDLFSRRIMAPSWVSSTLPKKKQRAADVVAIFALLAGLSIFFVLEATSRVPFSIDEGNVLIAVFVGFSPVIVGGSYTALFVLIPALFKWAISTPSCVYLIRVAAVAILFVGFHLDLLAS